MPLSITKVAALFTCSLAIAACSSTMNPVTRNTVASASGPMANISTSALASSSNASMQVYLTGYSYWDNTPRGSAQIARPVIHRQAGGTGTYSDPITVAVGHSKRGGRSQMDFPAGTRFYFPDLQKYGIVEDLCGDGPRPQNGPCHSGYNGLAWLDIYVGGRSVGSAQSDRCMRSITGVQNVILNPLPGLTVRQGEIALSTCRGA